MDKRYRLVFQGELSEGFEAADVRQQLGEKLKLDAAREAHLFSGQRVVLKRDVDEERAHRLVRQFAQLGAVLRLEAEAAAVPAPPPPPPPPVVPAPALASMVAPADRITCPHCGKLQPKAVFCIECATNMQMGIAARQEATGAARPEPAATMLRTETGRGLAEQAPALLGLGFRGRLSKRAYAMGLSVCFLLGGLLALMVARQAGPLRWLLALLAGGVLGLYYLRLCVLRFHDIQRSGWWALALAVPVLGFVAAMVLAMVPGTEGENRFGQMPDEGSRLAASLVSGACALALAWLVKPALERAGHEEAQATAQAAALAAATPPALEAAAERALRVDYAAEPGHKAFAVTAGAFGWKAGAASADEAEEGALAQCEARRGGSAPPCELVELDGRRLALRRGY